MIDRESQKPNNIKNKDGDWLHFENIFTKQVFSYAHCHWSIAAFTTSGYVNKMNKTAFVPSATSAY